MALHTLTLGGEPVRIRPRRDLGKPQLLREPDRRWLLLLPLGAPPDAGERFLRGWRSAALSMLRPAMPPDAFLEELRPQTEQLCAELGVAVPELTLFRRSDRWGSCDLAGRIIGLHEGLSVFPSHIAAEVLAHELCHLRVPDHRPAFWQLLSSVCPDWCDEEGLLRSLSVMMKKHGVPS